MTLNSELAAYEKRLENCAVKGHGPALADLRWSSAGVPVDPESAAHLRLERRWIARLRRRELLPRPCER